MPAIRYTFAAADVVSDELRDALRRRLHEIIGNRYGYKRPPGGFFLWLDVTQQGGSEAVALKLWKQAGLRVLPGNYAARPQADGGNPGDGYIRVAMVQDRETTAEALHRMVKVLG